MADEFIQHLFRDAAERFSDQPAIAGPQGTISYATLDAGSNRLANALRACGLEKGSTVGLLTEAPHQLIHGILGVLKAGGAFVPLDPALPGNRLRMLVSQAETRWLLCTPVNKALVESLAAETAGTRILLLDGEEVRAAEASVPALEAGPDDLSYVFFTSGSTGKPKGIAGRLKAIDHFIRWEIKTFGLGPGVRVSQLTAPSFDAILRDIFVPLCAGGTVCLPESREAVMDGGRLAAWLDRERVNLVHCVPSLFRALVNEPLTPDLFPELRHVLLSGEPLLPADVRRWTQTFGDRVQLVNLYGPSETTMVKLFYPVRSGDADRPFIPIGKPMDGARAIVVDESGQVCPPGMAGEIWIRTPYRSLGYYNQPELTREVFIPNPFGSNPNDLVYRTGDLGRVLEDGNFEFLGRRDGQVKIRGVRVELAEIESLLRDHESILDVAVVDREDANGTRILCAYLVANEEIDTKGLRAWLGQSLSEALIPSAFVRLDALPRTATGKVDRQALPAPAELVEATAYVPPRTPIEEVLAAIWIQILNVPQVGVHDSFFQLGGHSLLATQLLSRIRSSFGVELSLRTVFDSPTIAAICAAVEAAVREHRDVAMPPLVPVPRGKGLPLSFAQQRLWLLDQLHPGSPAYNLATVLRLLGPLDVRALSVSLEEIVARHEALRTVFAVREGEPVQLITPPAPFGVPLVDLRSLPEESREAEAHRIAGEEVQQPFDLERGPLVRPSLLWLGEDHHVALFTMHHIVSDDWSMGLLVRELVAGYSALRAGKPSPLGTLQLQYGDFAHWQRHWLQGDVLAAQLAYWREKLAGAPPMLTLPTDRARPSVQSFRGTRRVMTLSAELTESLRRCSRRSEATLFMTLLAAFDVLLSRLSGQEDLVVGTPVANRGRAELEGIMGFFVNTLVLRADLSRDPKVGDLLAAVRETALDAYVHQDLPFEKLVEALQPNRDLAVSPLFQVLLVLQNAPGAGLELPDITLEPVDVPRDTARLDLAVSLVDDPQGLWGPLEYSTDLFDEATILRFWRHFETLLAGFAGSPERRISDLPLLTEEERRQLVAWNDTATVEADTAPVHRLFERQAVAQPDAVALVFEDQRITYAELERRANQLAHHLRRLGVGPEVPVGLGLERSPEAIVGLLGIWKAGGFYVPLDPDYPVDRLQSMLRDAGAAALVTEERFARLAEPGLQLVLLDTDRERIEAEEPSTINAEVDGDHPAYVIYTSGSSGRPKGVVVPHQALANFSQALSAAIGLEPGERMLEFASLSFDASALQIFPTLISGATLVLDRNPSRLSPSEMLELCERQEVTILDLPAAVWRQWIDFMAGRGGHLPASIRTFLTGGESLPAEKLRSWARLGASGARLFSSYGPTEATVTTTLFSIASEAVTDFARAKVPMGVPLSNTRVHLLDPHQRAVPLGVPGEVYIGGAGLARGYLGRPDLTAAAFVPAPEGKEPGERLYRTGDLARRLSDGALEFLGRTDHQVKIRGVRVEPGEVQAALAEHPAVRQCVVTAREEPSGDRRLAAYLVAGEQPPGVAELRGFLASRLPETMIPSSFTVLGELPLLPSGKVDLRALPVPDTGRPDLGRAFVPPDNAVEEVLAGIFRQVLGLETVGVQDNFFELGGHSLLAAQAIGRIRDSLQVEPQLRQLFEAPTVAGIATILLADDSERRRLLEIAEVLISVDSLSDEEIEAMLAQDVTATESELS